MQKPLYRRSLAAKRQALTALALSALGTTSALASTAGPFGSINTFVNSVFLPGIGVVAVAGGVGYSAIHFVKHDYGKGVVGAASAGVGGFLIAQSSWFSQQAGISAATIGQHAPLLASVLHGFGL